MSSVSVSGTAPAVGVSAQFSAVAQLSNGTSQDVTAQASWQSSNAAVASVSAGGSVTGAGLGGVDIRASYQGVTGFRTIDITTVAPGRLSFSTTASRGWSSIDVTVNGQFLGTLRLFYEPGATSSSCDAVSGARLVTTLPPGTISYSARTDRGVSWSGTAQAVPNGCLETVLTCENRDCAPAPPPPPPPPPTPPPAPTPTPSVGFHVWGGNSGTQYLGFFSCVFCTEFAADSINNRFGAYGSQFSPTSIRNQFSQYGSPFNSNSACNQFATNPPKVFNANRSIYYGELTLNQFRAQAIRTTAILNWLTSDVCPK